jgi:alcohol dehydrogenase
VTVTAMVLVRRGELEARSFPRPHLGPDDGLLRVELAGICHTDVDIVSGAFDSPLPIIMGHEIVGVIEDVGERAARRWQVAPGDRVAVEPMAGCGTCRYCTSGESRFCADAVGYGTSTSSAREPHLFGAYAPLMYLAPGSLVHRLPAGMSAASGMLCTVAISNGVQWTLARGGAQQGDHVVVQGVGPIGLSCVAAARAAGAQTVIATGLARDGLGLELARAFGADACVAADEQDALDVVRHRTGGELADVVVDTTGSPQAVRSSLDLVRKTGTVVSAGVTGKDTLTALPLDLLLLKEIRLQGVFSFDSQAVRRAIALVQTGRFPFEQLITHRFPLAEARRALGVVADPSRSDRLKVVLIPPADEQAADR